MRKMMTVVVFLTLVISAGGKAEAQSIDEKLAKVSGTVTGLDTKVKMLEAKGTSQELVVQIVGLQLGYGQLENGGETAAGGVAKLLQKTTQTNYSADGKATSLTVTEPAGASGHASKDRCGGTEIHVADGQGGVVYYCAREPASSALTIPAGDEDETPAKKALYYLGAGALGAGAFVSGNYALGQMLGHEVSGKDMLMSGVGGAVLGILINYWTE